VAFTGLGVQPSSPSPAPSAGPPPSTLTGLPDKPAQADTKRKVEARADCRCHRGDHRPNKPRLASNYSLFGPRLAIYVLWITWVTIDLSRLGSIDGHLAASLHVLFLQARERGNSFNIVGLTRPVAATLQKNTFLSPQANDKFNTTIPLTEFGLTSAVEFSMFAKEHLQRPEMSSMSVALQGKFYEGVDELFANSALHSK
jgi:hypothetical protein